ncbi:cation-translocating P-type ATPase [Arcticibacter tournemirensis]|uniref:Cation-translocating P-type ATPase n=1 Tax=Arcticibacter tournemirensis TaxID=699437 RepID=A0A4Q0M8K8_9SPHI|nr:cation-translocating P-type ATPase [Arcticibacter tournemirensis]RXF69498.1 cation-translocating P-type ATPase [Arcticibacter tournemirensis]
MSIHVNIPPGIKGLSEAEVNRSREEHGNNNQFNKAKHQWWSVLLDMLKEPMLVLLIAVALLYLITGELGEAMFMLAAIVLVSGISFYQDNRNRKALEALEKLNEPLSKVIREGQLVEIPTHDIVVGDMMLIEEGNIVNADGEIVHSNDFMVDESALTGESYSVYKSETGDDNKVYSGTVVVSGLAICKVKNVGFGTRLGKLGESLHSIKEEATPLQVQIRKFVRVMAIVGIAVFLLVCLVNFLSGQSFTNSLLKGLTLAMSVLPEEIPVAFTTFMALGSWRLIKSGIIVKKISTVEALGSATVICTDKTGTITESSMRLQEVYAFSSRTSYSQDNAWSKEALEVIKVSMWASEPVPFDPMEKTLHEVYVQNVDRDERPQFAMVHEYPLGGTPPMMTHVFEDAAGNRIIAAKGAPEAILDVSLQDAESRSSIEAKVAGLAARGYRVLGVARSEFKGTDFPEVQQALPFVFIGLIAFYDPPKANINSVFKGFYDAGIAVKMITGDNELTSKAIALQSGLRGAEETIDGKRLMELDAAEMRKQVGHLTVFARMFPDAKLKAITALKESGHIVAMTGDGVNDAPALKASHIGIAMGQRGTEIAKSAAALIIADDDLSKMLDAVAMGRKIYANLKKAIQYIISIHIPIIGAVSLPLFLGWIYPNILTPVHVIFLELIMGPTCSIVYENEPMEKNTMQRPPRPFSTTFLLWHEMSVSVIQGLAITMGILFVYQLNVRLGGDEASTRTMVFTTLIISNIFLSLVNRSFYYPLTSSFNNRNYLMTAALSVTVVLLVIILYVPLVAQFFKVIPLSFEAISICLATGMVSVLWFELWKWLRRIKSKYSSDIQF